MGSFVGALCRVLAGGKGSSCLNLSLYSYHYLGFKTVNEFSSNIKLLSSWFNAQELKLVQVLFKFSIAICFYLQKAVSKLS